MIQEYAVEFQFDPECTGEVLLYHTMLPFVPTKKSEFSFGGPDECIWMRVSCCGVKWDVKRSMFVVDIEGIQIIWPDRQPLLDAGFHVRQEVEQAKSPAHSQSSD